MEKDWEAISRHYTEGNTTFYSLVEKIMTLSAGALTFSVALQDIFVPKQPQHTWLLIFSWAGFIISLFFGIAIFWGKHKTHINLALDLFKNPGKNLNVQVPSCFHRASNYLVFIAFFIGVICLAAFAVVNIKNV